MVTPETNQKNRAIEKIDGIKGGHSINLLVGKPPIDDIATDQDEHTNPDDVASAFEDEQLKAYKKKQFWNTIIISGSIVVLFVILVKYNVIKL